MEKKTSSISSWVVILVLVFANFILYANTFFNGFISDDIAAIVQNPEIGKTSLYISPLDPHPTQVVNSIIYKLVGLEPWLYHLNSVLWHILNAVLVFLLMSWLGTGVLFATLTAGLFSLHPIHTEAVNWISGLPYLLYSSFSLVTLLIIVGIDRGKIPKWGLVFIPFTSYAAFASSEKALVLPLVVGSYFLFLSKIKRSGWSLLGVCLPALFFFIKLTGRFGGRIEASNPGVGVVPTVFNPLIQIPVAIGTYLKLWLWPLNLTLYHEFILTKLELAGNVVALLLFFILIGLLFFKKQKLLLWGVSFLFIGLLPTLLPIKIAWIAAERYAYLPSLGLLMTEAFILTALYRKQKVFFWVAVSVVVLFYAGVTIKRSFDWRDPDAFWQATVVSSPRSSMAHNNMGEYYYRHGDIDGAIREFTVATELNPDSAEATYNLGNLYLEANDSTKAAELFEKAFTLDQKFLDAALGAVVTNLRLGKSEQAQEFLAKAQELPLQFPRDYNNWGVLYLNMGQKEKAREMFTKALEIDPTFELARQNLQIIK